MGAMAQLLKHAKIESMFDPSVKQGKVHAALMNIGNLKFFTQNLLMPQQIHGDLFPAKSGNRPA